MKKTRGTIMKASIIVCLSLLLGHGFLRDVIIRKIAAVNEVHHKSIGFAGTTSGQFLRYLMLSYSGTVHALLPLTKHKNLAVRCYAAWSLIDKGYKDLDVVFAEFLGETEDVAVFRGCFLYESSIASVLYHRYRISIDESEREADELLLKLDSIVLNAPQAALELTATTLRNREYSVEFNPQIERLAFSDFNIDAISYLSKRYPDSYKTEIRDGLIGYTKTKDYWDNGGLSRYFSVVSKLLAYRDPEANLAVVGKLKEDRRWIHDKERFLPLLQSYGINVSASYPNAEQDSDDQPATAVESEFN